MAVLLMQVGEKLLWANEPCREFTNYKRPYFFNKKRHFKLLHTCLKMPRTVDEEVGDSLFNPYRDYF